MSDVRMDSLHRPYNALVFGAGGGIGAAIAGALAADPGCGSVFAAARRPLASGGKVRGLPFELSDETSISAVVATASAGGALDLVFVATGILHGQDIHPEKSLRALDAAAMARAFQVNTIGPAMIAKHALPKLRKESKSVFAALSARVGSISDNRLGGWHSYRASKAALNMLVKTSSIELARTHPHAVCVALHPGTVATPLSEPFQGNVAEGNLFSPDRSASAMLQVLDGLERSQSGGLFAWDGQAIPF